MTIADEEQENFELSPLGLQYRAELPHILRTSDNDLEAALAALDRYLAQAPPPAFRKALLAWKGRFCIEHRRYGEAVLLLRAADALRGQSDLASFNTRFDLAKALVGSGAPREAFAVLAAALDEIEDPPLLLTLLCEMVRVAASTGQALPPGAEVALSRAKQFYGIDEPPAGDLAAEALRVEGLVNRDA